MMVFDYSAAPYPIREDFPTAYREAWSRIAKPGNWWTGAERVAIARETRNAVTCEFCRERKAALSPYGIPGEHNHEGGLPERAIDAVHRIITDQDRITQAYIDDNAANGLSEEHYVELLGICVLVLCIDEFHRALGLKLEPLPASCPGEPDGYRPLQAVRGTGFVSMIPPDGATGKESDLWEPNRTANVLRALSLVPNAVRDWYVVHEAQYITLESMKSDFGDIAGRPINRMQIELVASRVSAINECFY